jgi:hypothetical protein
MGPEAGVAALGLSCGSGRTGLSRGARWARAKPCAGRTPTRRREWVDGWMGGGNRRAKSNRSAVLTSRPRPHPAAARAHQSGAGTGLRVRLLDRTADGLGRRAGCTLRRDGRWGACARRTQFDGSTFDGSASSLHRNAPRPSHRLCQQAGQSEADRPPAGTSCRSLVAARSEQVVAARSYPQVTTAHQTMALGKGSTTHSLS